MNPGSEGQRRNRVTCGDCGASERVRSGSFPLGWSIAGGRGRTINLCPGCTRTQLDEIEAGLDFDDGNGHR